MGKSYARSRSIPCWNSASVSRIPASGRGSGVVGDPHRVGELLQAPEAHPQEQPAWSGRIRRGSRVRGGADSAALYARHRHDGSPLQARLSCGWLPVPAATRRHGGDRPTTPTPGPTQGSGSPRPSSSRESTGSGRTTFPIDRPVEEIWIHFQGWRVNYESIVYNLALEIDAPPALWSGPRRQPTPQIAPKKLLDRTPEDPQGAKPANPSGRSRPRGSSGFFAPGVAQSAP